MALVTEILCQRCFQHKIATHASGVYPTECDDCTTNSREFKRAQHFAKLNSLTMDERVRKIEQWIYDYQPVHVEPPRF